MNYLKMCSLEPFTLGLPIFAHKKAHFLCCRLRRIDSLAAMRCIDALQNNSQHMIGIFAANQDHANPHGFQYAREVIVNSRTLTSNAVQDKDSSFLGFSL